MASQAGAVVCSSQSRLELENCDGIPHCDFIRMVVYWICPWGEWQNADSWPSSTIVPAEIQEGKHMHLKTWTQKGHALCDFSSSLDNFSYIQNSSVSALSQDRGRENRAASECRAECRNSEHLLAFLIPADPWLVVTSLNHQVLLTCGMSQDWL